MSNVLTKDNNSAGTGAGNWDEAYQYDGLNRLTAYQRGSLSSGTITGTNLKFGQTWSLDALGNWAGYGQTNSDSTLSSTIFPTFTQSRKANSVNEIDNDNISTNAPSSTSINNGTGTAWALPTYDASGNQTNGPKTGSESTQLGYIYDGWNRLVGVDLNHDGDLFDAGDVRYSYDGTGRRITKFTDSTSDSTNNAGSTEEYYQNEQNQVLEVRTQTVTAGVKSAGTNPKERYLWDLNYLDSPVFVEYDTNLDGTADQRLYTTWDANHDITSLVTQGGQTVERYEYTPYGQQIILNGASNYAGSTDEGGDWTVDTTGSDYGFLLGFQGLRLDQESGNWYARARYESPAQGNWTQRDPLGTLYQDGSNLYLPYRSNPSFFLDPSGLKLKVANNPNDPDWQQRRGEIIDGLQKIAGNCVEIFEEKGEIKYRNSSKSDCCSTDCTKLLKDLLNSGTSFSINKSPFGGDFTDVRSGTAYVTGKPVVLPEIDANGSIVKNLTPVSIIVWHELFGHAYDYYDGHPLVPIETKNGWKPGFIDKAIAEENRGRKCLAASGAWPGMLQRAPWYYEKDNYLFDK